MTVLSLLITALSVAEALGQASGPEAANATEYFSASAFTVQTTSPTESNVPTSYQAGTPYTTTLASALAIPTTAADVYSSVPVANISYNYNFTSAASGYASATLPPTTISLLTAAVASASAQSSPTPGSPQKGLSSTLVTIIEAVGGVLLVLAAVAYFIFRRRRSRARRLVRVQNILREDYASRSTKEYSTRAEDHTENSSSPIDETETSTWSDRRSTLDRPPTSITHASPSIIHSPSTPHNVTNPEGFRLVNPDVASSSASDDHSTTSTWRRFSAGFSNFGGTSTEGPPPAYDPVDRLAHTYTYGYR